MEISELISDIKDRLKQPELSKNTYLYPVSRNAQIKKAELYPPEGSHNGQFNGAIDIFVPEGTTVIAPISGEVVAVIDSSERYGASKEFENDANAIEIRTDNGEHVMLVHLAKGSAKVKERERVEAGWEIAQTGLSGWMSEPHLHFFVYKWINPFKFIGLKPKFRKE